MAWTEPTVRTSGVLLTAAMWNTDIEDNLTSLASHIHTGAAGDGPEIFLPSGSIAIFDTDCPSGWTRVSAFDSKFIRGNSSYGGTGGADTHTHTLPDLAGHTHIIQEHSHPATTLQIDAGDFRTYLVGGTSVTYAHVHSTTGTPDAASDAGTGASSPTASTDSNLPPYIAVVFCKKN